MTQLMPPPSRKWSRGALYLATILVTAVISAGIVALLMNIVQRKDEAREHFLKVVDMDEDTIDPAIWGRNFPREYDGYLRTADDARAPRGGSEAMPSKLDADPRLRRIFAGYPFSVDYRERRGHAHMLEDQDKTERVLKF